MRLAQLLHFIPQKMEDKNNGINVTAQYWSTQHTAETYEEISINVLLLRTTTFTATLYKVL